MICPTCGKNNSKKAGWSKYRYNRAPRYECKSCGRCWAGIEKNPKLLYFDIETSHTHFKGWRPGQQYVASRQITQDWFTLSWSAKWVCTTSMFSYVIRPRESKKQDDKRIVTALWKLFNEADIIIGHNSDNFDIKKMNKRFIYHGLKPPKPYRTVDTLKIARRVLGKGCNSLDYLMKYFGLSDGKTKMHDEDWDACEAGDPAALRKMSTYNDKDVIDGESVYLLLRAWDKNHPNLGLYYETSKSRCKNCGSTQLVFDNTCTVKTPANSYYCWTCVNCGANGRTPESARYEMAEGDAEDKRITRAETKEKRLSLMR